MYALNTIIAMNNRIASTKATVETETTRHCSYKRSRGGIVLHSALQRSTGFLEGRRADLFEAAWLGTNSATKRDQIVESYFNAAIPA